MRKRKYLIVLSIIIILGTLILFREPIKAGVGAFALNSGISQPENTNGAVISTSTLNYLTPGTGTTTLTLYTEGTDQANINIFAVASTVATTDLRWTVEFSHSTTSVASQQVWFPAPIEVAVNATTTVIARTAKEFAWRMTSLAPHRLATSTAMNGTFDPDTVGAITFQIKDIAARWTRVVFYLPTPGASLTESTALGAIPVATSTNVGIQVFATRKDPL